MNRVRVVGWVAATLVIAACGSSGGGSSGNSGNAYAGKTMKLGAVLSITGAGGVYGPQSRDGMMLAISQINSTGGVNGAKIDLEVQDDASDKATSQQKAQTLITESQDLALLGPTLSNSAVAVHPLAESLKVPILAVSTTGIHIVPDCNWTAANPNTTPCRYVFRDSLGEQTAIPDNIKSYAADAHPSTGVLLVAQDDKFSSDGGKIVQDTVGQYNITLLKMIGFQKATADLTPYVTQAVQLHPDVIFITSLGGIPAKIMNAARNLGFQGQFLGGNGFNTATVSAQAGAAGKGARSASAWYIGNTFASNAEFVSAYKAAYNKDPDQFSAQGYTAIKIIADSAKRANLTFTDLAGDRDKLRAAMETVNIQTPLGPFQFTSNHDVKQTVWIIEMDGAGGFKLDHQIQAS
ncbi:MAG TPA: ABC transporter substrate-binding protein [Candidatus Dormibacteraeota bacterium]|nr:ABC transporter substrate-binding protein [Candidatus Dormibacteraeota bacterium]HEX2681889.1 ABC transporter substrate-binding protein [Candidatus Dormibacteraeota bacterium]